MASRTGSRGAPQNRALPVPLDQVPGFDAGKAASGGGKRQVNKADRAALVITVCMAPVALFILPTSVLFIGGMIPTIIAFVTDRTTEKYLPMIVGSLNFCGVMPAGFDLWQGGSSIDRALSLLGDPFNLAVMLGSAGVGWLIYLCVPAGVAALMVWRSEQDMARWQARQEALVAEWGPEVTGEVDDAPGPN